MKLVEIGQQFAELKRVGATAEDLANTILEIYTKSSETTAMFEQKMAESGAFMDNFYTFGGQDAVDYAQAVYTILKEMNAKLEALG